MRAGTMLHVVPADKCTTALVCPLLIQDLQGKTCDCDECRRESVCVRTALSESQPPALVNCAGSRSGWRRRSWRGGRPSASCGNSGRPSMPRRSIMSCVHDLADAAVQVQDDPGYTVHLKMNIIATYARVQPNLKT